MHSGGTHHDTPRCRCAALRGRWPLPHTRVSHLLVSTCIVIRNAGNIPGRFQSDCHVCVLPRSVRLAFGGWSTPHTRAARAGRPALRSAGRSARIGRSPRESPRSGVFCARGTRSSLLLFAVGQLTAVIQLAQSHTWHPTSAGRIVMLSVVHPAVLGGYLCLGWWLFSRRETLATRWLISEEAPLQQPDSQSHRWGAVAFRVVGLYFMMVALVPLNHACAPDGGGMGGHSQPIGVLAGRRCGHCATLVRRRCVCREEGVGGHMAKDRFPTRSLGRPRSERPREKSQR
jgi:hypothetical protein